MKKNNLIRFAQTLFFLPFVAGTVSLGGVLDSSSPAREPVPIVFAEKDIYLNEYRDDSRQVFVSDEVGIEGSGVLAFSLVMDQRARDLDLKLKKAKLIDDYFGLRGMPMKGTGMRMVEEAERNGLDWRLLPAIAVRESTGGKFECAKVPNNPFGWGSCRIGFSSYEEAIETLARNLGGNNPNTQEHYEDKSTKDILRAYNPPSVIPRYAEQVMSIMRAIGNEDISISPNT